jgi:hypothetical protein
MIARGVDSAPSLLVELVTYFAKDVALPCQFELGLTRPADVEIPGTHPGKLANKTIYRG